MESPAATQAAIQDPGKNDIITSPTTDEIKCPKTKFLGRAAGTWLNPNKIVALAAKGAINIG
jgi:hypothetical protein